MENYENKTNYKDLPYKFLFTEEDITRFHDITFLKNYCSLYNLLSHLLTNKISTNDANVDQICLVIT